MISKKTFSFLKDLAENNNREWFTENKYRYEEAKVEILAFTEKLLSFMKLYDSTLITTTAAMCQSRIYRDVRFSKNKTPYKTNFGIIIAQNGKKSVGSCYYLHIQPNESFAAGGYWMPEAEHLKKIRQEIDYNASELNSILTKPTFVKTFGELSKEDKLKTRPKGFEIDNPQIELLKLKSYTVSHPMKDSLFLEKTAAEKIGIVWKELHPLNNFLQNAIAVS